MVIGLYAAAPLRRRLARRDRYARRDRRARRAHRECPGWLQPPLLPPILRGAAF